MSTTSNQSSEELSSDEKAYVQMNEGVVEQWRDVENILVEFMPDKDYSEAEEREEFYSWYLENDLTMQEADLWSKAYLGYTETEEDPLNRKEFKNYIESMLYENEIEEETHIESALR